jgi:hypothetical protein
LADSQPGKLPPTRKGGGRKRLTPRPHDDAAYTYEHHLLFNFMANKEKVAFPPVFQPLLGPIDATAESVLRDRLEPVVPDDADDVAARVLGP